MFVLYTPPLISHLTFGAAFFCTGEAFLAGAGDDAFWIPNRAARSSCFVFSSTLTPNRLARSSLRSASVVAAVVSVLPFVDLVSAEGVGVGVVVVGCLSNTIGLNLNPDPSFAAGVC
jgi:hypothetical protein